MNTQNPKIQEAAASRPSKTKDANQDASQSAETLQHIMSALAPLLEFQNAADQMMKDDVKMTWDIRVVRGQSEPFAHLQGTTCFPQLMAYNMRITATSMVEYEIKEKIARPLVARLQREIERQLFADRDAQKEAAEAAAAAEEADEDLC